MGRRPVIISACLLGLRTRYDGSGAYDVRAVEDAGPCLLPVCPEQLGGLCTPRPPAVIVGGTGADVLPGRARVIDSEGRDVTDFFLRGAEMVGRIARISGARRAVLRERSPSCGVSEVCGPSGPGRGRGVTAALLEGMGIELCGRGGSTQGQSNESEVLDEKEYL